VTKKHKFKQQQIRPFRGYKLLIIDP
jgi:hypothetical protein